EIFQTALNAFDNVLSKQQEIIISLSNMFTLIYHAESAALRTLAMQEKPGAESYEQYVEMTQFFLYESLDSMYKNGKDCLEAFLEGEQLNEQMKKLDTLNSRSDFNLNASVKKIYCMMQNDWQEKLAVS
ncbi:MAG: hypothetical protein ABIY35_07290, partial [Chitinophagaceae bacterium]